MTAIDLQLRPHEFNHAGLRTTATGCRCAPPCAMSAVSDAHAAVAAEGLAKSIDDRAILGGLTFRIPRGRFTALLGANGAGKTTLLKILAGLLKPTSGRLDLFGQALWQGRNGRAVTRVGLIGHNSMLYGDLTARENLVFFARMHGMPDPAGRADRVLETMGMAARSRDPVKTFSRGMVQRTAIARALLTDPELLLADEPFAGLDAPARRVLEETLWRLRSGGMTIIMANHDISQSLELAGGSGGGTGQVLVLRRGRLVLDEPAASLTPGAVLGQIAGVGS